MSLHDEPQGCAPGAVPDAPTWPPPPTGQALPTPAPRGTLTGRAWLDKTLGWLLAGLPLILLEYVVPALLYPGRGTIMQYRQMGRDAFFLPTLALPCACVPAQVGLYCGLRPRLPALARGFGWGLWVWTPLLITGVWQPRLLPLK